MCFWAVSNFDLGRITFFLKKYIDFDADFDLASFNGMDSEGFNYIFASSQFWLKSPRTIKSDLESLIYSIWFIANVPMSRSYQENPEGYILCLLDRKQAESRMLVITHIN